MNIKEISTNELIPYENNPRKNDNAVDAVAKSIEQFGFKVPIVIDSKNIIVCGHTRLKAAQKLGLKKVPCVIADDLTPEQIKAFRLADNKTAEFSTWDFEKLSTELISLSDLNFDMTDFNFNIEEYFPKERNLATGEEIDIENFSDEKFDCTCPKCGFKFNR